MLVISNEVAVLSHQVLQVMVIVTDDCDSLTLVSCVLSFLLLLIDSG